MPKRPPPAPKKPRAEDPNAAAYKPFEKLKAMRDKLAEPTKAAPPPARRPPPSPARAPLPTATKRTSRSTA